MQLFFLSYSILIGFATDYITLENHCTRTAQSSRGGCSQLVYKIEYLHVHVAVNKGNILVKILPFKQLGTLFCALVDCNLHAMTAPFEYRGFLACTWLV